MIKYYIYLTTNLINGKKYIGQHKGELNDSYYGSGTNIIKAIQKYGKENFKKEILCICSNREELDEKEKEYIKKYNAVEDPNFYNLHEGGSGGDGWRSARRYLQQHPEIYQQNAKRLQKWALENPELYREKVIKPFIEKSKEWRRNNPEEVQKIMKKVNEAKEQWQKNNPDKHQKQIEKWRKKGSEANSKKVICINTGEIFNSISEAARHFNIHQGNISKCLKGERQSAGKHPITKEKLKWQFAAG